MLYMYEFITFKPSFPLDKIRIAVLTIAVLIIVFFCSADGDIFLVLDTYLHCNAGCIMLLISLELCDSFFVSDVEFVIIFEGLEDNKLSMCQYKSCFCDGFDTFSWRLDIRTFYVNTKSSSIYSNSHSCWKSFHYIVMLFIILILIRYSALLMHQLWQVGF